MPVIFLTTPGALANWTVPSDWTNNNNSIEIIGTGGPGTPLSGTAAGGGAAYAKNINVQLTPNSTVQYMITDPSSVADAAYIGSALFTASISGTTMTVTSVNSGVIDVGLCLTTQGSTTYNTRVIARGTGTGGLGTYTIDTTQTSASALRTGYFCRADDGKVPANGTTGGLGGAITNSLGTLRYAGGAGASGGGGGGAAGPRGAGGNGSGGTGGTGDGGFVLGSTGEVDGLAGDYWTSTVSPFFTAGSGSGGGGAGASGGAGFGGMYGGGGGAGTIVSHNGGQGIIVISYNLSAAPTNKSNSFFMF